MTKQHQSLDDIFGEVEAASLAKHQTEVTDGTAQREMDAMRKKGDAEMASLIAQGAIDDGSVEDEEAEEE